MNIGEIEIVACGIQFIVNFRSIATSAYLSLRLPIPHPAVCETKSCFSLSLSLSTICTRRETHDTTRGRHTGASNDATKVVSSPIMLGPVVSGRVCDTRKISVFSREPRIHDAVFAACSSRRAKPYLSVSYHGLMEKDARRRHTTPPAIECRRAFRRR